MNSQFVRGETTIIPGPPAYIHVYTYKVYMYHDILLVCSWITAILVASWVANDLTRARSLVTGPARPSLLFSGFSPAVSVTPSFSPSLSFSDTYPQQDRAAAPHFSSSAPHSQHQRNQEDLHQPSTHPTVAPPPYPNHQHLRLLLQGKKELALQPPAPLNFPPP